VLLAKTPRTGETKFVWGCDICHKPILSAHDANVLFDMENALETDSPVIIVHKKSCMDKALQHKQLFSKDFTEFLESFLP